MIQNIISESLREQTRKIDFEFFRLLDKHNLSVKDFVDKKYKTVIQKLDFNSTKYSIRRTRGRNAKKDIDYFIIKTNFTIN